MRACVLRVICVMRVMRMKRAFIICKRVFDVIARGYPCVAGVSHFVALVPRGIRVFLVYTLLDARILHVCSFIFSACALVVYIHARVRSACAVLCLCLRRFTHEPPIITIKLRQCC